MDADERLRLDYDQATELIRALMDVRFKLLALVPTFAGAAVAFLGSHRAAAELLALGLLGLLATSGSSSTTCATPRSSMRCCFTRRTSSGYSAFKPRA